MSRVRHPLISFAMALAMAIGPGCGTIEKLKPSAAKVSPGPDALSRTMTESVEIARQAAAEARKAPPEAVTEELLPAFRVGPSGARQSFDQRFDVSVNEAPAREFFMSLVENTPYNMVLDPDVAGTITFALKNVTISDVMQAVRDVYGYEYEKMSYGYHVRAAGLQTRIFHFDYPNIRRAGSSRTSVVSGEVSDAGSSGGDDGESTGGDGGAGTLSGTEIATEASSDMWAELSESLRTIVGTGEGRSLALSPNTGIVIIRAMPHELRAVEAYIKKAQLSLERQVILEAKILEIRLNDSFQSGINWALIGEASSSIVRVTQTGGGTQLPGAAVSEIAENLGFLTPDALNLALADAAPTPTFGGVFTLGATFKDFSTFIELLETQGTVSTLSSPRVSTVNNQKAVIKIGQDEFFVTDVSSTTVTGTTTTTTPDVTLTPFFSGISLDVTPQVSDAGNIILHIHPSISNVQDDQKVVTVGGVQQSLPLALSTIRESDSVVRAKSGQVIVIGGLMEESTRRDRAATPWLNRIPLLGSLFRHQLDDIAKTELVTLLRATVVDDSLWQTDIENTAERIQQLTDEGKFGRDHVPANQGSP